MSQLVQTRKSPPAKAERKTRAERSTLRFRVIVAPPREIRNGRNLRCKLSLRPFTFLNYTKGVKYEAPEKNAVSAPKIAQPDNL